MTLAASAAWVATLELDTLLAQMVGFSLLESQSKLPGRGLPTLKERQGVERQQGSAHVDHLPAASFVADRE